MIELVKAIVEPIIKAISVKDFLDAGKSRRLHVIGTELFLLYASLNEVLVTGRQLLDVLQEVCERVERSKNRNGLYEVPHRTNLPILMIGQRDNLQRAIAAIKRLGLELQVIAPSIYLQVAPIFSGKSSLLHDIAEIATAGLTHFSANDIDDALGVSAQRRAAAFLKQTGGTLTKEQAHTFSTHNSAALFPERVVSDLSIISYEDFEKIYAYIHERNPGGSLDDLEKLLVLFRAKLETTFSLTDILLSVGDARLQRKTTIGVN